MSSPYIILRGTTARPKFEIFDENGARIDMTVSGRKIVLRLTIEGSTTPIITRDTSVTAEREWTSQSTGIGLFKFSTTETAALIENDVVAEAYYHDTTNSRIFRVYGPRQWKIKNPDTGTL